MIAQPLNHSSGAEVALVRLFEASSELLCILSSSGFFLERVNPAWTRVLGWEVDELVDRPLVEDLVHPDDRGVAQSQFRRLVEGVPSVRFECRLRSREGDFRRFRLSANTDQDTGRIYAAGLDLTMGRILSEGCLRLQRMSSVGSMAMGVAHELNNVLEPILLAGSLLRQDEGIPDSVVELAETIQCSAERGAVIVDRLLRFGSGRNEEAIAFEIQRPAAEVAQLAALTFPKNIRVVTEIEPDPGFINGRPTEIYQVLLNLALNARDAMPDGGALLFSVRRTNRAGGREGIGRPGPFVVVELKDTGCGVDPAIEDNVFDLYFTTKPSGKGTGLGLAAVKSIIYSHGGTVEMESQEGSGTTFRIFLPSVPGPSEGETE